jgi:hypothetical protein
MALSPRLPDVERGQVNRKYWGDQLDSAVPVLFAGLG